MRNLLLSVSLLPFFVQATYAQWNNWSDAKSVKTHIHYAQSKGYCYFSQFHIYDVRSKNPHSSIYREQTGEVPYIYALDFYYASGTYFTEEYQQRHKKAIIDVVKQQWRENRAIPSFSWHLENPYVTSDFGDYMGCRYRYGQKDKPYPEEHRYVIREILTNKGGKLCGYGVLNGKEGNAVPFRSSRDWFRSQCREVADIINQLIDDDGKPIPIIFRIWHECEDSWMWWGASSVKPNDYKKFFIYTEKMIKKYAPESEILWAYCTDRNWNSEEEFMARYPGDKYVDFIGYDDYEIGDPNKTSISLQKAQIVSRVAKEHGKIAGLFETGNIKAISQNSFLTEYLYPLITSEKVNFGFVQLWTSGSFHNELQYSDRRAFLRLPNLLLIDIDRYE